MPYFNKNSHSRVFAMCQVLCEVLFPDLSTLIPTTTLLGSFSSHPHFISEKTRHREVKDSVLSPTACEWPRQGVSPGWSVLELLLLTSRCADSIVDNGFRARPVIQSACKTVRASKFSSCPGSPPRTLPLVNFSPFTI